MLEMRERVRVMQFVPYFPPHKGGLETVAEEFSKYFVKLGYGDVINVTFDVGQYDEGQLVYNAEKLIKNSHNKIIGYYKDGYKVLLIPAFDLIHNFPFPKFWTKQFRQVLKISKKEKPDIIQTHTRFFISSFMGGILAKLWKVKWVHVEHGSEYVKVSAGRKNKIAYLYDRMIGKFIFKKADQIIPISHACRKFIEQKFVKRKGVEVVYRGLGMPDSLPKVEDIHKKFPGKIIIGYIGRLYKRKNIESLIKAYYISPDEIKKKIQVVVVGDGEDLERLKKMDTQKQIYFTGGKAFHEALAYQQQFDIHFHPSSPGGGLATTILQAMYLGCLIVATPYEGADEVIENGKNGILLRDDSVEEIKRGIIEGIENLGNRESRGEVNKGIICEKFDWGRSVVGYVNLYKK